MALTIKQILRRHGAFVAAVTAVAVGVAILLQDLVQGLIGVVAWGTGNSDFFAATIGYGLLTALPFAIGYFISLWIIAPIAEELRIGHVVTRAILATGVGATVMFIVLAALAITGAFSIPGSLFANSLGGIFNFDAATGGLARALTSALTALVGLLPLGVLGGVLLWLWRKDHPPRHPLSGLIDEV
ncbi:MAG: hypothetical protein ABI255_09085 [Microbacteriaceae bacterium]